MDFGKYSLLSLRSEHNADCIERCKSKNSNDSGLFCSIPSAANASAPSDGNSSNFPSAICPIPFAIAVAKSFTLRVIELFKIDCGFFADTLIFFFVFMEYFIEVDS